MAIRPLSPDLLVRGSSEDPRLGRQVQPVLEGADVAIIGCGGNTGEGPDEIRRWLYQMTPGLSGELGALCLADLGNVVPEGTVEETHASVESAISNAARTGTTVIFLGGGRDLVSASQSGVFQARPGRGSILQVDAWLSIQPGRDGAVAGGDALRSVLERWEGRVHSFVALAVQSPYSSKAELEAVRSHRGRVTTLDELRSAPGVIERMKRELSAVSSPSDFTTVSVSLRAASAAVVPGVTTPLPDGLDAEELAKFCEHAGRVAKVQLLDVTDLSPALDVDGRTARLAALCLWRFLLGVANR